MTTNETTSITAIVTNPLGNQSPPKASLTSRVTITIAEISHSSRSSSAVLR